MVMAATALGIDLMLPAFGSMRIDFGLPPDSTAVTGTVTTYFLGLALAQVVYGPLSDRFGRKPVLYFGLVLYAVSALVSALAPSLGVLLIARFSWGLGAAGPRVMALSIVRDVFAGDRMARAMSFIMAIFILVPVVAPSLGALITVVADWRWVFGFCVIFGISLALWSRRLPETLRPEHTREFRFRPILAAARIVVSNRATFGYTLALTALFGVFMSYLASSEIIFTETFDRGAQFPFIFGGLALAMGGAVLANTAVVMRFGPRRVVHGVLLIYLVAAAAMTVLVAISGGKPPFWPFIIGLGVLLSSHGLLIPNANTVAMDPMGEVAGTASAVIGTVTTAGGALLGAALDSRFDGTVTPITLGFLGLGLVATLIVLWVERGKLFRPLPSPASIASPGSHVT